mmetsp:Transcript_137903/g.440356  ORF Transcript_137903/g.440356 Transcript_137903/m.440356 type:complete len:392 (+) Transcript_137903:534-1709(+)
MSQSYSPGIRLGFGKFNKEVMHKPGVPRKHSMGCSLVSGSSTSTSLKFSCASTWTSNSLKMAWPPTTPPPRVSKRSECVVVKKQISTSWTGLLPSLCATGTTSSSGTSTATMHSMWWLPWYIVHTMMVNWPFWESNMANPLPLLSVMRLGNTSSDRKHMAWISSKPGRQPDTTFVANFWGSAASVPNQRQTETILLSSQVAKSLRFARSWHMQVMAGISYSLGKLFRGKACPDMWTSTRRTSSRPAVRGSVSSPRTKAFGSSLAQTTSLPSWYRMFSVLSRCHIFSVVSPIGLRMSISLAKKLEYAGCSQVLHATNICWVDCLITRTAVKLKSSSSSWHLGGGDGGATGATTAGTATGATSGSGAAATAAASGCGGEIRARVFASQRMDRT